MPYDDPDYDEDWYDDDDEPDDDEAVSCPECGRPVYNFLDKCPACGYWLSAADRRALRPGESKPSWIRITTIVVLAAMLAGLFAASVAFF
jgi:ribosomal protein L37E